MTDSTTIVNACDVSFWVDNASGTPVDISGTANSVTITIEQNVGDSRVFGSRWPRRKMCGHDCTIDYTILYSTAEDEALDIFRDWSILDDPGARTVKIYIPDKNVGSDFYSGEFVLDSMEIPATAGEGKPIEVTGSLMIDGALALSKVAT